MLLMWDVNAPEFDRDETPEPILEIEDIGIWPFEYIDDSLGIMIVDCLADEEANFGSKLVNLIVSQYN